MKYKDIPGYEKRYRIYEDGRIWSYRSKRFLRQFIDNDGYIRHTLCVNNKRKNQTLHRWIYLAFIGDIPKGKQVNHKDGNKINNSIENLEVMTHQQNVVHAWENGLQKRRVGSKMWSSKLKEKDIQKIRSLYKKGHSQKEIGEMFGITQSNISHIVNSNTWSHVKKN